MSSELANSMPCGRIPYATEQGINSSEQGISFEEQGILDGHLHERPRQGRRASRLSARGRGHDLNIFVAQQRDNGLPLDFAVFHYQQLLGSRGGEAFDSIEGGY